MRQAVQETARARSSGPIRLKIAGMDCGDCALTIQNSIAQLDGVENATVSFTAETLEILGDVAVERIEQRLHELGYRLADPQDAAAAESSAPRGWQGFMAYLWAHRPQRRALLVGIALIPFVPLLSALPTAAGFAPLDIFFALAVLVAGAPVFIKGLRALTFGRRITIDLLMAVAATGALIIGAGGEAITVMLLFMLGEALEGYSAERARDSLRSLIALQPQTARLLEIHNNDHRHEITVPVDALTVGSIILVRPGERIPADGSVVAGTSTVNQAPVTGESMPVMRTVGDPVMAGTVNGEAALEVRVSQIAAQGTIARIARLVAKAQSQRSPQERFVDRFARWYTPAVVLLAFLVVALPVVVLGQPLLNSADGHGWLYRGLALLIIACPCALVISIPVTVVSGLSRLAQLGVLVKGGAQLDRLADVAVVAFDKTGTLTHGRPRVTGVRASDCQHPAAYSSDCASCDEVMAAAAGVERGSEHPVAHAIVAAAGERQVAHRWHCARDVTAHPGRGVTGELSNGVKVAVGSREMFDAGMSGWDKVSRHADPARASGDTVMYVATDNTLVGYIGVADQIREAAGAALAELAELRPPVKRIMLTGDHPAAAARVVDQVGGIDEVSAGLLPEQKLAAIEELKSRCGVTAMVGDGINDAPALARADVGFAMGAAGTAAAMETADVVLMQDDLSHVPVALRMARASRRIIKQNVVLALGLKLAILALAIVGITTLWMAVLADVGATLLVTANGMRLLRES
jgi:Cd2+/Zn2+-exporting ATPase